MQRVDRNLALVAAVGFFFYFGYSQLVLLPLFLEGRGVTAGAIGVMMAVMPLTAMLVRPFSGGLIARFGGRPILVFSGLFYALLIPAYLLVTPATLPLFAVLRAMQGIGLAGLDNSLHFTASQCDTGGHRARTVGRASVFYVLGFAVAPAVAELIYKSAGFTWIFILGSASCLLAAGLALLLRPAREAAPRSPALNLHLYRQSLANRNTLLLLALNVPAGIASGCLTTFIPLYAAERNVGAGSLFFLGYCATTVLARTFASGLSDRIGRRRVLVPALLLGVLAPLSLWDLRAAATVAIAGLFFGVAQGLHMPAMMGMILDSHSDSAAAAVAMALVFMAWDVGSMAGASAFGYLSSAVGYGPAFAISAVLLPIAAAGVFLMREPAPAVADPAPAKAG